jgi:hypothetical protein
MAIEGQRAGEPGSEQGLGVDVGAAAGTGALTRGDGGGGDSLEAGAASLLAPTAKVLKPLPHGYYDYASAGMLMAAPWLFGFSRNRRATANAVISGLGVLGLSLFTKYPLGAVKAIPFPVHGVIEAAAGALTATAPWLLGFSRNRRATLTHVLSGLGTLAVVAMTDYQAAEGDGGGGAQLGSGGAGALGEGA